MGCGQCLATGLGSCYGQHRQNSPRTSDMTAASGLAASRGAGAVSALSRGAPARATAGPRARGLRAVWRHARGGGRRYGSGAPRASARPLQIVQALGSKITTDGVLGGARVGGPPVFRLWSGPVTRVNLYLLSLVSAVPISATLTPTSGQSQIHSFWPTLTPDRVRSLSQFCVHHSPAAAPPGPDVQSPRARVCRTAEPRASRRRHSATVVQVTHPLKGVPATPCCLHSY